MKRLGFFLLAIGAATLVGSVAWWWLTYRDVISYSYISASEASTCLVGDSDICRLARALCRGAHPLTLVTYRAAAFWIGLALASASLTALARGAGASAS
jgi:hypothetical protein